MPAWLRKILRIPHPSPGTPVELAGRTLYIKPPTARFVIDFETADLEDDEGSQRFVIELMRQTVLDRFGCKVCRGKDPFSSIDVQEFFALRKEALKSIRANEDDEKNSSEGHTEDS